MRAGSLCLVGIVLLLWPVARCGGTIAGSSDGGDGGGGGGGGACSKTADCPTGYGCYYAVSDGCSATGTCRQTFTCKGAFACACDGTSTSECGAYAAAPVAHPGQCNPEPPPCGSGLACELCDVSGYLPNPMQPPATTLNACTPSEISAFVTACIDTNATQQSCNAWQTAEVDAGACLGCVFSLQSGASWSALVCSSTSCDINTAGCVDLVTGTVLEEKQAGGPGSCGDLVSAANGCTSYACATCDMSGPGSDFDKCTNEAAANECASFTAQVNSTTGACAIDSSGAPQCFPHAPADFPAFLNVFCGTGP